MFVQPLDGPLGQNPLQATTGNALGAGGLLQGGAAPAAGDNISRFVPPWSSQSSAAAPYAGAYDGDGSMQSMFAPLMGVLQQLMQMLQSLMGSGCNSPFGSGNCPGGNEQYFQNAKGSSEGDPHLSFNGQKWNSMASQPDLLRSDSIPGGFQISTQATPPNSKGVTSNQSATISLNNGATTIAMNDQGQPSITSNGQQLSIARGQTIQLGDGESVTYEQNGSLRVCAQNGQGGRIDTTLTPHADGVNVDVTAHDVDLGGALVNGFEQRHDPDPQPLSGSPIVSNPIVSPIVNQPEYFAG
ncbi:MAG: hypothetical protein JO190_07495 [Candidatus Eremiobacteraeota bacterium]|nr:hypothetical protein [Candidatus Eremiobacteraeota bacterium]